MNPPVGRSDRPERSFSRRRKRMLNAGTLGSIETTDRSRENGRLASREHVTGRKIRATGGWRGSGVRTSRRLDEATSGDRESLSIALGIAALEVSPTWSVPNKPMVPAAPNRPITNPLHPLRRHIGQPLDSRSGDPMRERVYGTVDYCDGVLGGVADFHGSPHAFELDDDADAPSPIYRLVPVAGVGVEAAMRGSRPAVSADSVLRARGRFLLRDEDRRGEDGEWAMDVEWLDK